MTRFKISKQCFQNRGVDGLVEFIHEHSKEMIKKALENNGTGLYTLSFVKTHEMDGTEVKK